MVRTRHIHCHGLGSIPGRGTKIPQAARPKKKSGSNNACPSQRYLTVSVATLLPSTIHKFPRPSLA